MIHDKTNAWWDRATASLLGGVNSPSRSYYAVGGGTPVVMERGDGAYLYDVDGNRYIDYLAAYGPIILGHRHPALVEALRTAAETGTLFGTPTPYEVEFAELLRSAVPQLERVRFVNSGTEAVMTTIRVARGVTGRRKIIKFEGCYHGHADSMLVAAGSGPSSLGIPDSLGVTKATAEEIVTVPYNNLPALEQALDLHGEETAAVMVEPIVGNFGIVAPSSETFLRDVIELAHKRGALVIFDEVITAFRFHYGTAAQIYGVEPDLYALGKIIGGGLPIGAYGGKQAIMEAVAPLGAVYQAGTMAGNPASMISGIACLKTLRQPGIYEHMDALAQMLQAGILECADKAKLPVSINRVKGALTVFFGEGRISNYSEAKATDGDRFAKMFHGLLHRGVLLAPSKYEAWFVSAAHTIEDIDVTLEAVEETFLHLSSVR